MFLMLPLWSKIARGNVTLSLKYLLQNLCSLPISFYRHIDNNANYIKITNKSIKAIKIFLSYLNTRDVMK